MEPVRIGLIGCGQIAPAYLKNLRQYFGHLAQVAACADVVPEAARQRAAEFSIPRACRVAELLDDPRIELVLNLTIPEAHHEVSRAALHAGKHVFVEKPLALTVAEGRELLALAASRDLQVGGAADTFLGGGQQACRRLLDAGTLGTPVAAHASISLGVRQARYYRHGMGPLFDMGPYFLTALIALLGPVVRVTGSAHGAGQEKPYPVDSPQAGQNFCAQTASTLCAVLDFAGGTVATLTTTCDSVGYLPELQLYGTQYVLVAPDPNAYGGVPALRMWPGQDQAVEAAPGFAEKGRGLGVAEMALALRQHQAPLASGKLMLHVLEIMSAIHEASARETHIRLQTSCEKPPPFAAATVLAGPAESAQQ